MVNDYLCSNLYERNYKKFKLTNYSSQAMIDHLFTLECYQKYELGGKSKINEDFR